jgi:hypothetical protein
VSEKEDSLISIFSIFRMSIIINSKQMHTHCSLFVLAIRSPQTKQKYLQRFGYFLDFAKIGTEKEKVSSVEERCNMLAELAKSNYEWLARCIFNYLQLLKSRVESKEIKASTLRNNIKPIKLFLEQIEFEIHWKKLLRGMPKERKYATIVPRNLKKSKELQNILTDGLNLLSILWFPQECDLVHGTI